MIRLKSLLTEQPGATIKQGKIDKSGLVVPFNAKKIADLIYNAKGYVYDDEQLAKNAIMKNIKNIAQYKQVSAALMKLSGNRGIGEYLVSFMNLSDRLEVAGQLMNVLPENQWEWTIKKIVPYEDLKHITAGGSKYSKISGYTPGNALASNTATTLINTVYNKEWQGRRGELTNEAIHDLMFTAAIISAPLAGISSAGLAFSSAIGLADATNYFKEGDSYTGGLMTVFSVLPGIGPLGRKLGIPAAQWTKTFLVGLAKKLGSKTKLTPLESKTAQIIIKNKKLVFDAYDDFVSKLIGKNSSKLAKFSDSAKQAINATIKDPKSKIAATLGLYFYAIPKLYDKAYIKLNGVTAEEFAAAVQVEERNIMKQAIADLDAAIARKQRGKLTAKKENIRVDKPVLTEIDTSLAKDILPQFSLGLGSITIAVVVISSWIAYKRYMRTAAPAAAKSGFFARQMKWIQNWLSATFGEGADDLERLKREFGNKGVFISKRQYLKIIKEAGEKAKALNERIIKEIEEGSRIDIEKEMMELRGHFSKNLFGEYEVLLRKRALKLQQLARETAEKEAELELKRQELELKRQDLEIRRQKLNQNQRNTGNNPAAPTNNPTPPPPTGGRYVPNMTTDEWNNLNVGTRAYMENNNLDWTFAQALSWQRR